MDPRPGPQKDASEDAELLRRVSERDESALAQLYDRRSRLVYSAALNILRSVADAEEVTQQVFLRIWDKAEVYSPRRGGALAWIVTLTRRLAIDRTRSKHFKVQGRQIGVDAATADAAVSPRLQISAQGVEAPVLAREVAGAMERLGDQHREVIELSYFRGLSHSQIAEHLDTPLGTIKSRIRDAVAQLRRILDVEV